MTGLRAGASGLSSYGEAMSVVGSNIANINTVGYKGNRVNFQDLLATGVRGTPHKIGKGVMISSVQADFSSGSMESSSRVTDLALEGDGFFTLRNSSGRLFYSRAGNFEFDREGTLVTVNGEEVLVRDMDPLTNEVMGSARSAKLIDLTDPPLPTGDGTNGTGIVVSANLDADQTIPDVQFDPTNVQSDMFNFSSAVTVIDARGGEHVVNLVFRRIPDGPPLLDPATGLPIAGSGEKHRWQWYMVVEASEVGGPSNRQVAVGGGFLKFSEQGRLLASTNGTFVSPGPAQIGPTGELIPPGPPVLVERALEAGFNVPQATVFFTEDPQTIGINFGSGSNPLDPTDERTGLEGVTQFAATSKVGRIDADGQKSGALEDFDISGDGVITGFFDNGTIKPLYRLFLTRFINNPGLLRAGDNKFQESRNSGQPIHGNAQEGGFATVRSRSLEKSNVDLSTEFVRMIETQRAFQANAKVISTSDEMMADLVNIKR